MAAITAKAEPIARHAAVGHAIENFAGPVAVQNSLDIGAGHIGVVHRFGCGLRRDTNVLKVLIGLVLNIHGGVGAGIDDQLIAGLIAIRLARLDLNGLSKRGLFERCAAGRAAAFGGLVFELDITLTIIEHAFGLRDVAGGERDWGKGAADHGEACAENDRFHELLLLGLQRGEWITNRRLNCL